MSSTYKLLVLIFALWLSQSANVLNKLLVTDPLAQSMAAKPPADCPVTMISVALKSL